MLERVSRLFVHLVERWLPNPIVFCAVVTGICYILALALTSTSPLDLVNSWYGGLWEILAFTMQVILLLLTGYTLAKSSPVQRLLESIASLPRSQGGAVIMLTLFASLLVLVHWGVAMVASAVLARTMVRKVPTCDFGFLIAGAYSSTVIAGCGLGGTIPLVSATAENEMNFIARYTGVDAVPLTDTVLSSMNVTLIAATLIGLPLMFRFMMPRSPQPTGNKALADSEDVADNVASSKIQWTPAQRIERNSLVLYPLFLLGAVFLVYHFATHGFSIDFKVMIVLGIVIGMALHRHPMAYVRAFNEAAHMAGPIILQFPFYGGIMAMTRDSGLAAVIAEWFISFSTEQTFPFFCFLSAAIINFAIPSASGHWIVQGPILVPAALELGVSPATTAMAVAYGDQTANMLQPFWALPILALANLNVRHIMGYCVMTFLLSTIISTFVLFVLG